MYIHTPNIKHYPGMHHNCGWDFSHTNLQPQDEIAMTLGCDAAYAASVAATLEHNVDMVPTLERGSGTAGGAEEAPSGKASTKDPNEHAKPDEEDPPKKKVRATKVQARSPGIFPQIFGCCLLCPPLEC